MKTMTFNLKVDAGSNKVGPNNWQDRCGRIAAAIEQVDADIVGTQEGLLYMLRDIHSRIHGYEWIGSGREGKEEGEFCAIFYKKSRFRPIQHGQFWLSETPQEPGSRSWETACPRICTWAFFEDTDTAQRFAVYNTHLDHRSQEARMRGIQLINKVISEHQESHALPAQLMGDMNATPDNAVIQYLRDNERSGAGQVDWTDTYASADGPVQGTFHDFHGTQAGEPIDYIFVTAHWQVQRVAIFREEIRGGYPSDHYPVHAVCRLVREE